MELYVCYGTWTLGRPLHAHPCGEAHAALRTAGHEPQVVRTLGLGPLPGWLNDLTPRREVRRLTGQSWVPVLVTDGGEVIRESRRIIEWARAHPAERDAAATG